MESGCKSIYRRFEKRLGGSTWRVQIGWRAVGGRHQRFAGLTVTPPKGGLPLPLLSASPPLPHSPGPHQMASNMAAVQLRCRDRFRGARVQWTGTVVRVEYDRRSTDAFRMLPAPLHSLAASALSLVIGKSADVLVFTVHMDFDGDGAADAAVAASQVRALTSARDSPRRVGG